jgi:DNA-binding beta-propeller fold protein YncE
MSIRAAVATALMIAVPAAAQTYHPAGSVPLGAPDRWDYVVDDAATGRVYVAHGDRVTVVDGRAGKVVGEVTGMPGGTHGTGIVRGLGVTDDGEAAQAVVFDPRTYAVIRRIPAGADADGIAIDPASGHALVADGDPGTISIVDPVAGRRIATVAAGEAVEYLAVADGRAFVAGKDKGDVVVLDPARAKVLAHWPMPDCSKPHGLAVDPAGHRVFVGCVNSKMVVLDARSGRVVATAPIGTGSDSLAWDPVRRRVFSANGGDGTISVIQQETADRYRALDPIPTKAGGRNMAVDERTGRLFVSAGEVVQGSSPRRVVPGSLALLMFDPSR